MRASAHGPVHAPKHAPKHAPIVARRLVPLLALALNACLLGPDYVRPNVEVPATYRFASGEMLEVADTVWWEQFQEPVLDQLIATALERNRDVKIAAARIDEFAAQVQITRSAFFPQVGAGFTASRQRVSQIGGLPLQPGIDPVYNAFSPTLSATLNLDVFGRTRRLTEAARADLAATEEGRRETILTLVAAVAGSYINLRSLDRQLEIAQATAASRADSVRVFTLRFSHGVVSQMELAQSQSEYEAAQATIPVIEMQIGQQEDALSVLLAQNPGPIPRGRELRAIALPAVPAGVPSDLLSRRPDLLAAEQNFIAENARIGAARALYFPDLSVSGMIGSASAVFSSLLTGPAYIWSVGGAIAQPLFTGGNIAGQVHLAEAREQEALYTYLDTVQKALQQVEDALIALQKSQGELVAQGRQVDALAVYARLARKRYDAGYTSYIEVLDAERSLFNAQLTHTQTESAVLTYYVSLYKAMGGGWVTHAERMTMPAPASGASATEAAQTQAGAPALAGAASR
ncbi:efflux transporter outer membrane subunit [Paraburkholderia sp. SIMBA_009]|uniref:Multidrug efflux system outer membrane protein n=1 Tax=Paraburkholderia tropica TaxID=92647 RepID=A0ABX5MVV3_9BURK|nr:efflux transporter outer membrane subunit [Paraburkholderia tropica]PXX16975.1 multidrug efflux system outer membrane protein [Paraburkholderia tropica]PZW83882.1 multidrug efflux system outer membrane protein [Paraburkholderia tropica]